MPPKIVFAANLWSLVEHPSPRREWSLVRKVRAVAEAGFDAVTALPSAELAKLVRAHGLRFMGFSSTGKVSEFRAELAAQVAAGAELVNVQLGDESTLPKEGTRLALALMREARRQKIYAAIEVHRDTITETPEKTYAIADAYRRATGEILPLTWDHSHLAVVKHVTPKFFNEVLLQRADLIQAAQIFHLRPFNGQHAQVPVIDARGRLTPEFRAWLKFAEALLQLWLDGTRPGGELWICPEIGPIGAHGYNLSVMEPSWPQAIVCLRELRKVCDRLTKRR
jgi:hypothetical protein